ncbi:hypothetical protein HDV02_002602 [Globomyces sp. JEL0801]|nr:hypothetical protein HDV02_002602 [Globomyces sp. JEL0801]
MDSSRYFVIKIVDGGTGQHAFVGLGFPERSYAFDMNVALQDHAKRVRGANEITTSSKLADLPPPVDYSLKEGQKIQIKLGNKTIAAKESGGSKEAEDLSKFSIAPPPASKPIESVQWGTGGTDDFEGDFGDFKGGVFGESKEGNKGGWTSFE